MTKAIEVIKFCLGAAVAFVATWNFHPFLAGVLACFLVYALVDSVASKGDSDDGIC